MNTKDRKKYSEVYSVLNLLGNDYISKLPSDVFNLIKGYRLLEYTPEYTFELPIEEQNIKRESLALLTLFYLKYWCESTEEKEKLIEDLKKNDEKYKQYIAQKNDIDVFWEKLKNNNLSEKEIYTEGAEFLPAKTKDGILVRIGNFFKKVFGK